MITLLDLGAFSCSAVFWKMTMCWARLEGEGIVIPALAESVVQTLSLEIHAALGVHRRVEHNP